MTVLRDRLTLAEGARAERRRLRAIVRQRRDVWRARMGDTTGGKFAGAARAVQVCDEVLVAMRAPRRNP